MKTIAKTFTTAAKANTFYLRLCDKYDHVELIRAPFFIEEGVYIWQVK